MGASFIALTPSSDSSMSYTHLFDIKGRMLDMICAEAGEEWKSVNFANMNTALMKIDNLQKNLEAMAEKELKKPAKEQDKVLIGVHYFINHSDCEGEFNTEECLYIKEALIRLNESENGTDKAVAGLIDVFQQAIQDDGIVAIW